MGIVRLAKSLRILKILEEYESRDEDIGNKITGNRVYMDFVSIVYRIQEDIRKELNYLLFTFYLIIYGHDSKMEFNYYDELVNKYSDHIKIPKKITSKYILEFKKILNEEKINELIYLDVINFISDMVNNKLVGVEYILIAFDGIPSYGKIIEQRQRRYMRKVYDLFSTYIYSKDVQIKNDKPDIKDIRKIYDTNQIKIDIKSAIEYVYSMYDNFRLKNDLQDSTNTTVEIKNKSHGEGEKILIDKLHNDFKKYGNNKSYVFYSPDGDSVILCLNTYIQLKIDNLTVIKTFFSNPTKQFNNKSQYIKIKSLYERIVYLVNVYSGKKIKGGENLNDSIVRDFIFMMNFFGNDFIHQVPTMDIGTNIINLLFIYAEFISTPNNYSILNISNNKVFINYKSLQIFIKKLAHYEKYLILDTYLARVDNANKYQKTFGRIFTLEHIIKYCKFITGQKQKFYNDLVKNKNYEINDIVSGLNVMMDNLENKITLSGIKYSEIFIKLELKGGKTSLNDYAINIKKDINYLLMNNPKYLFHIRTRKPKFENVMFDNIEEIEKELINNSIPINFDELHDSDNHRSFMFDYENIRGHLPHEMMITTKNDIDLYMLEWKAGKWKNILNSKSFELGYDHRTQKSKDFNSEIKRYQYEVLKLSDTKLDKLLLNYCRTLSWITDYYMNSNYKTTKNYISTWGLTYDRSPFITMLSNYLESNDFNQLKFIFKDIFKRSLVKISEYISKDHHKLYIYPHDTDKLKRIHNNIDPKYRKAFPDIDYYVSKSMERYYSNNDDEEAFFDCRMISYFSKCIFESRQLNYKDLRSINMNLIN
jgi:5'-3' exonuclease